MQRFFSLLLFTVIVFAACQEENQQKQENKYTFLRKGKFMYQDETPGMYLVKRYDNFQDEYLTYYDMDVRFSLEWLSDSVYIMRFDTILNNPKKVELYADITDLVKTCIITNVTDTSYTEKATTNLHNRTEYTDYLFLK